MESKKSTKKDEKQPNNSNKIGFLSPKTKNNPPPNFTTKPRNVFSSGKKIPATNPIFNQTTNIYLPIFNKKYPNYENAIPSLKPIGAIRSYSSNSYKGLVKPNNEDKIIVESQIHRPNNSIHRTWPKMSFFGIFDGHGGENCSNFIKNNFVNYLSENKHFPYDIKKSILETFEKIETDFLNKNIENDKSGSCVLICLITETKIFLANLGDSRAILSTNFGTKIKQLTYDHKPNNINEFERLLKNGSKIYFEENEKQENGERKKIFILDKIQLEKYTNNKELTFREYPSNLAVCRSIGDFKYKKKEGSIINIPEIFEYDLNSCNDFIIMGCDGIFDDLSNQEIIDSVWSIINNFSDGKNVDINLITKFSCDMVIKFALEKMNEDNLSCIVIGLEGLQKFLNNKKIKEMKHKFAK